jgi:hypothetical protein
MSEANQNSPPSTTMIPNDLTLSVEEFEHELEAAKDKAKKNPEVQEVAGQRKSHIIVTIRVILIEYTKGVVTSLVYLGV